MGMASMSLHILSKAFWYSGLASAALMYVSGVLMLADEVSVRKAAWSSCVVCSCSTFWIPVIKRCLVCSQVLLPFPSGFGVCVCDCFVDALPNLVWY